MNDASRRDISFPWNGLTLAGTLHLPPGDDLHPLVVMMQGSGPANRDCDDYFPPIRDAFLSRGIATYSFDKPGCGESTGDWRDHAIGERSDQVEAAIEALGALEDVDGTSIGVWGQSQGGWMAQMIAARRPDLPFAIANSGPSIGVERQDRYGCEHMMRSEGHTEDEIEQALKFITRLHEAAREGVEYATIEAELLADARGEPWYGYATVDDEADWRSGCRFVTEGYEPIEALTRIRGPFLAVYGGRDVLGPAWQSARDTGDALAEAGNRDATVVVFPDGDHRIGSTGGGFVPGYLDLLADWIAVRAAAESDDRPSPVAHGTSNRVGRVTGSG